MVFPSPVLMAHSEFIVLYSVVKVGWSIWNGNFGARVNKLWLWYFSISFRTEKRSELKE